MNTHLIFTTDFADDQKLFELCGLSSADSIIVREHFESQIIGNTRNYIFCLADGDQQLEYLIAFLSSSSAFTGGSIYVIMTEKTFDQIFGTSTGKMMIDRIDHLPSDSNNPNLMLLKGCSTPYDRELNNVKFFNGPQDILLPEIVYLDIEPMRGKPELLHASILSLVDGGHTVVIKKK